MSQTQEPIQENGEEEIVLENSDEEMRDEGEEHKGNKIVGSVRIATDYAASAGINRLLSQVNKEDPETACRRTAIIKEQYARLADMALQKFALLCWQNTQTSKNITITQSDVVYVIRSTFQEEEWDEVIGKMNKHRAQFVESYSDGAKKKPSEAKKTTKKRKTATE